jgi:hypothetical protein
MFTAPFCYLSGHKLVQFSAREKTNFKNYVENGGFVFVDDCNHDIDGLFAKSFEAQMAALFGPKALRKIPSNHDLYHAFFDFNEGPPTTSFELNGWGDDLVHDYLKAIFINNRMAVLYSNKDYGCEWDYDFRNKRGSPKTTPSSASTSLCTPCQFSRRMPGGSAFLRLKVEQDGRGKGLGDTIGPHIFLPR